MCFSHDSRYLFSCCGSIVKVFNTTNGECVHDLKAHAKVVTGVFLNPGNVLQLFSCSEDGRLIVWDYLDGEKLKEHNLHQPLYGIISVNADKNSIMLITKTAVDRTIYSLNQWKKDKSNNYVKPKLLIESCGSDSGLVSFGCSREFVASGLAHKLTVYSTKKDSHSTFQDKDKYNKKKAILCVACHPHEYVIAAGLENGKIILWHNFFNTNSPVISRLHWHALPCLSLAFTPDGSNLLSGGHECVLVKWQMSNTEQRDFKPRMGAPLTQVLCSPNGNMYATEHSDNVIQLLTINFKVVQVYRGLTRGSIGFKDKEDPIPCGLKYEPRSQALITNGLPGHLQFFSLALNKQLYNLDIVGQNYISPENVDRPSVITRVTSVAVSNKGEWLATYETWDDGHFTPERRLKFWSWSSEAQTYSLNTTVECPHDGEVTSMSFRPHSTLTDTSFSLVTVASDCCFKKWSVVDDTDIYRSNTRWDCESVGFYRGLEAGCAEFSSDSTTLAVGFGHLVTLWDPDKNIVHVALAPPNTHRKPIKYLLFGNDDCSNYLVTATAKTLLVWDLLTLTVSWQLNMKVSALIKDPMSNLMAFVTSNSTVNVFRPSSSSMVYSHEIVSSSTILSAVFIPHGRHGGIVNVGWPGKSQIYVFNAEEELITFDFHEQQVTEKTKLAQNLPESAMRAFLAEKTTKDEVKDVFKPLNHRQKNDEEFISALLHSNEPVASYCDQYLRTLLVPKTGSYDTDDKKEDDSDSDEDSESDMEVDDQKPVAESLPVVKKTPQKKDDLKDDDLDFLLSKPLDWIKWCGDLKLQ